MKRRHTTQFSFVEVVSDAKKQVPDVACALIEQILPGIRAWADPDVVVLPRTAVSEAVVAFGRSRVSRVWKRLASQFTYQRRSEAARDPDWVQVVACGVPRHEGKCFVFTRTAGKKVEKYGKHLLWKGCHVRVDDRRTWSKKAADADKWRAIKRALINRFNEDLHLQVELTPVPLAIAWDAADQKYLGIMFEVPIQTEAVARSLDAKEFKKAGRYPTVVGAFKALSDIKRARRTEELTLEPWSRFLLESMAG
ncbi:MAG: hypothetical protein M9894_17620 [Planctomycetes bacterium]|nr:hypothetical protein [Planctomycetota bacterium]